MERTNLEISLNEAFDLMSTNLENHCNCTDYTKTHQMIYGEIKEKFFDNNTFEMHNAWIKYQTNKYQPQQKLIS